MTSGLHTALYWFALLLTLVAVAFAWFPFAVPNPAPYPVWSWRWFILAFLVALIALWPK